MWKNFTLAALLSGVMGGGLASAQIQLAYVANVNSKYVEGFEVSPVNGSLLRLPSSPFDTGQTSNYSIAIDQVHRFVYVGNYGSTDTIAGFKIEPFNGALIPLSGTPFAATPYQARITADPLGRFVYAISDQPDKVTAYSIDAATGQLTHVQTLTGQQGTDFPTSVTVDPLGRYVYVTNFYSSNISAYSINPTTGELTDIDGSPFRSGVSEGLAINPSGSFAYVSASAGTYVYSIDPSSGALVPLENPGPGDIGALSVAVDRNGSFLYAAEEAGIGGFSIDPTGPKAGSLTPLTGSPFSPGKAVVHDTLDFVVLDFTGSFAYANYEGHGIAGFTISPDGALTLISSSPFSFSSGFSSMAIAQPRRILLPGRGSTP
jgi:6-phosphogluconolactonase